MNAGWIWLLFLTVILHADETHSFAVTSNLTPSLHPTPTPISAQNSFQRHDYQHQNPNQNHAHIHYSMISTNVKSTDADADADTEYAYDDSEAESQFGTKEYWDEMYQGYGDFSSEEYSWYFGFGTVKPYWVDYMPNALLPPKHRDSNSDDSKGMTSMSMPKILTPGVGNDPTLLDLYQFGYRDITAFDYSRDAIERQRELLEYDSGAVEEIKLYVMDARDLKESECECHNDNDEESAVSWTDYFDIIFEKGALDAIYLSGPEQGNVQLAVEELTRVIKPGGYFMSVSGVVPEELRREMFHADKGWEWMRDGSDDLKAGVFVWKRV